MDDLRAVLTAAWALLADGVVTPDSPWRSPTLVTTGLDGWPAPRTVVLRAISADRRMAEFHTDRRSPKCAQIAADPRAALHGWDAARRVQLRLEGSVLVADAAATDRAWDALPSASRSTYTVSAPPGSVIASPDSAPRGLNDRQARDVFTLLLFRIDALEYLALARDGHRRARFHWPDGRLDATWLVP